MMAQTISTVHTITDEDISELYTMRNMNVKEMKTLTESSNPLEISPPSISIPATVILFLTSNTDEKLPQTEDYRQSKLNSYAKSINANSDISETRKSGFMSTMRENDTIILKKASSISINEKYTSTSSIHDFLMITDNPSLLTKNVDLGAIPIATINDMNNQTTKLITTDRYIPKSSETDILIIDMEITTASEEDFVSDITEDSSSFWYTSKSLKTKNSSARINTFSTQYAKYNQVYSVSSEREEIEMNTFSLHDITSNISSDLIYADNSNQ
ncbi:hypothetical protein RF11_14203 [Thelohanellus kitauei]|uniref:Uncharacterized protein n=1 Tax=Thelohanellus kitauei TaxID=669202 RepID=A0A0C2IX81_THEKT|nr:hypothetical protein RF11_14203 [Thelohanellus kitauei]